MKKKKKKDLDRKVKIQSTFLLPQVHIQKYLLSKNDLFIQEALKMD